MRSVFYNFSQGVDAMTDRRMLPNGFAVVMDNVDLRTGYPRPFKAPAMFQAANTTTTRIWEFLGKWYLSDLYRTYASEVTQTQQRIYYAEEGPGHAAPQKIVNDVQDALGTPVPQAPLLVSDGAVTVPRNLTLSQVVTGNLAASTLYAYRVAAKMANGIQQPCQESQITLDSSHNAVNLTWDAVDNAVGYVVFGRVGSQEQFLKDVGLQLSFLDDGTLAPSGAFASTYDSNNPYTYVYTYVRSVGTMEDESGPSPLSVVLNTGNGRVLTRQVQVDGFMDNATVVTTSETSLASAFNAVITGMLYQNGGTILTFASQPLGPWFTGDKLRVIDTASGVDYSVNGDNMEFNTFDAALDTPAAPTAGPTGYGAGSSFSAGTYIWKVAAIRGNSSVASGSNAATPASSASGSVTIGAGERVYIQLQQVVGASFYELYRSGDGGATWNRAVTLPGSSTTYRDDGTNEATGITLPSVNHTLDHTLIVVNTNLPTTVPQPVAGTVKAILAKTVVLNAVSQTITQNDSVVLAGASQSALNGVQEAFFYVVDLLVTTNINTANPGTDTWDGVTLPASTVTNQKLLLLTGQTSAVENGPWVFNGSSSALTRPIWYTAALPITLGENLPQVYIQNGVVNAGKLYVLTTTGAITVDTTGTFWALTTKATAFFIAQYSETNDTFTSLTILSGIGNYTYWRIYRSGDTAYFLRVAEVPVSQATYEDTVPTTALGVTLPTSYTDNGFVVTFKPPPSDLQGLELFNGMLFGHTGNVLRWTPIGLPDAFPDAFTLTFSYPILAKAAFASGLIVLCQDAIYRVDGFSPTTLGLQKTLIEDGLIAPRSVQKTSHGLIYLARRGVMLSDGNTAVCLTDNKLPYSFFIQPGTYTEPYSKQNFWWYTTDHTVGYAALAWDSNSPMPGANTIAATLQADMPQQGPIYGIRSFVYRGKYFLYYSDVEADYTANTMACVDLAVDGRPVTTLGAKIIDAHTSSIGDAYVLAGNDGDPATQLVTDFSGIPANGGDVMDFGPDGNLYIAWNNSAIVKYDITAGTLTLFAGSYTLTGHTDATGSAARFSFINDLKWGTDGNLYVTDAKFNSLGNYTNYLRKITSAAVVTTLTTIATTSSQITALAVNPSNGHLYTVDKSFFWDVDLAGVATSIATPIGLAEISGMAFDATVSNLYAVDTNNVYQLELSGFTVTLLSVTFTSYPLYIESRSGTTFWVTDGLGTADSVVIFDANALTVSNYYTITDSASDKFALDANDNLFFYEIPSGTKYLYEYTQAGPGLGRLMSFVGAEAVFNGTFAPTATNIRNIYRWENSDQRIPIVIRTGEFNVGLPNERKWWGTVNFHGEGTAQIRVYNDGALIAQTVLDAREAPNKPRRINLPNGTKGYGLSFELVGDYNHRATEICYSLMPNRSGAE